MRTNANDRNVRSVQARERDAVPLKGLQDVAADPADLGLRDARTLLADRRLSSVELTGSARHAARDPACRVSPRWRG
jgi:hypothetical protein